MPWGHLLSVAEPKSPGVVVRKFSSFLLQVSQENFRTKTTLESRVSSVLSNPKFAKEPAANCGELRIRDICLARRDPFLVRRGYRASGRSLVLDCPKERREYGTARAASDHL